MSVAHAERTTAVPADAEVVFDVVTDLENLSTWLPAGVEVERYGPNLVRLWLGEEVVERNITVDWDKLTITWGNRTAPSYRGTLWVLRLAANRSAVTVRLTGPAELPVQRLDDWLIHALQALVAAVGAERRAAPRSTAVIPS